MVYWWVSQKLVMKYCAFLLFVSTVGLISSAPLSSSFAVSSSLISTDNLGQIKNVQQIAPKSAEQQSQNSTIDKTSQNSSQGFPGNWTVPIDWQGTIWNPLGTSLTRNKPTLSTDQGAICTGQQGTLDTDGDAICDNWETSDPTKNPLNDATHRYITCPKNSAGGFMDTPQCNNGTVKYDLCITDAFSDAWGGAANQRICPTVGHKDIYVEIDYMDGHSPNVDAIKDVIRAFGTSPVSNTATDPFSHSNGITLHVVVDEKITPYVTPINVWQDPSTSNCPPRPPGEDCDDTNDFKHIKHGTDVSLTDGWFGSPTERAAPFGSMILDMKHYVYHYATFIANWQGDVPTNCGPSGTSETLGNDLVVSLGCGFTGSDGHGHSVGSQQDQAGTFMHELGHNLNLGHGGPRDLTSFPSSNYNTNCKPNELSVMSWSRQVPAFVSPTDWVNYKFLDYSRGAVKTLTGSDLKEGTSATPRLAEQDGLQLVAPNLAPNIIVYGTPGKTPAIRGPSLMSPGGGIDWSGDSSIPPPPTPPPLVFQDVNNLGLSPQCVASIGPSPDGQIHKSMDEWNNLQYYFLNDQDGQDGLTIPPEHREDAAELTGEMVKNLTKIRNQFTGLLDPISSNGSSSFKVGKNISVLFQLNDTSGNFVQNAKVTFTAERINGSIPGSNLSSSVPGSPATLFHYDLPTNTYNYVWKTKGLQDGTWAVRCLLNFNSTKESVLPGPPPIPSGMTGTLMLKP